MSEDHEHDRAADLDARADRIRAVAERQPRQRHQTRRRHGHHPRSVDTKSIWRRARPANHSLGPAEITAPTSPVHAIACYQPHRRHKRPTLHISTMGNPMTRPAPPPAPAPEIFDLDEIENRPAGDPTRPVVSMRGLQCAGTKASTLPGCPFPRGTRCRFAAVFSASRISAHACATFSAPTPPIWQSS